MPVGEAAGDGASGIAGPPPEIGIFMIALGSGSGQ
jgi:hypothetical protein